MPKFVKAIAYPKVEFGGSLGFVGGPVRAGVRGRDGARGADGGRRARVPTIGREEGSARTWTWRRS